MSEQTVTYSPYQAHKIVNKWIADKGFEKKVPPQMLYTYVGKGYIESVEVDGKKRVTVEQLSEWFVRYERKNLVRVTDETVVDENQLTIDDVEA